eukprot:5505503-Prymnesium_polylepis.2
MPDARSRHFLRFARRSAGRCLLAGDMLEGGLLLASLLLLVPLVLAAPLTASSEACVELLQSVLAPIGVTAAGIAGAWAYASPAAVLSMYD